MEPHLKALLLKDGLVLGPEIGKGSFGTVFRCTDVKTQISYAVKKVDLRVLRMQPQFVMDRLKRECEVLQQIEHPSVVRLYKTIDSEDAILMVMEMVLGMELFEMILAVQGLSESDSCAVFIQVASALHYMHQRGVVHRDIKPENILVQGSTTHDADSERASVREDALYALKPRVKLIDFGLSKVLGTDKGGSVAKSLVGTPRYVAPEIIEIGEHMRNASREMGQNAKAPPPASTYTEKVDCYSAGVLLHVMLSACFPQFGEGQNVVFTDKRIANVSSGAKDLISKLMRVDPARRFSMRDALCHPWVRQFHARAAAQALSPNGQSASASPPVTPRQKSARRAAADDDSDDLAERLLRKFRPMTGSPARQSGGSEELEHLESMESMMVDATFASDHHAELVQLDSEASQTSSPSGGSIATAPPSLNVGVSPAPLTATETSKRLTGMKRQMTKGDAAREHANRPRNQSLGSQKSGSKSSIEVLNLPGAAQGVWGPFREAGLPRGDSGAASPSQTGHQAGGDAAQGSGAKGPLGRLFEDIADDELHDAEAQAQAEARAAEAHGETQDAHTDDGESQGGGDGLIVPRPGLTMSNGEALSNIQTNDGLVNPELLLQLQTNIAKCFRQSFEAFKDDHVVSPGIVSSAVASRELLSASETILKKLEQTSLSVLDLLPDMQIAVEEGEFGMAVSCFDTIKEWIRSIQGESQDLLKANVKVIAAVNNTLQLARRRQRVQEATKAGYRVTDALALEKDFVPAPAVETSDTGASGGAVEAAVEGERQSVDALKREEQMGVMEERRSSPVANRAESRDNQMRLAAARRESISRSSTTEQEKDLLAETAMVPASAQSNAFLVVEQDDLEPISTALAMLQQIDRLLQKHASFWSHMEVVVDVLMQRANHVESMVNYTKNPRLRGRFLERVQEYSSMWTGITHMCQQFHRKSNNLEGGRLYQFLTEV